jgi:large subunit ribosomal protein L20
MNGLKKVNLNLNRKVLADIAALEPESFKEIVAKVKAA